MKIDEANKWLQSYSPQLLIIGFMPDGKRGIPIIYKEVFAPALHPVDAFGIMEKLTDFKVYELASSGMSKEEWMSQQKKFEKERTEKEERDLLAKLKAKYETQ